MNMKETNGFLMEPGCPWVGLREWGGLPNVRWCEEQLCAWIATPANTWTNLAYIFVGFYFWWFTRKEKSANLRFYGTAAQWVGWSSFAYHASITFVFQVFDFLGMFVFFYLVLVQNFARMGWVRDLDVKKNVWILTLVTTCLAAFVDKLGFPIQGLVVTLLTAIFATEIIAARIATRKVRHGYFVLSLGFLGIGAAFSAADVTRRFCEPSNHWLQGHALWHVFGSVALFFSIRYYRQFYSRETGRLEV